mgnify:CR=1
MKVLALIIKVLGSLFMIPIGILCGIVFGAALLLLLVLAIPLHFIEQIWNPDDEMERWD